MAGTSIEGLGINATVCADQNCTSSLTGLEVVLERGDIFLMADEEEPRAVISQNREPRIFRRPVTTVQAEDNSASDIFLKIVLSPLLLLTGCDPIEYEPCHTLTGCCDMNYCTHDADGTEHCGCPPNYECTPDDDGGPEEGGHDDCREITHYDKW